MQAGKSRILSLRIAYVINEEKQENTGGRTRTRTLDPLIKSQLLYQLSYAPSVLLPAACIKAAPGCPAAAGKPLLH
jgi:hypothetical protein